jgi:HEAT repeat protein
LERHHRPPLEDVVLLAQRWSWIEALELLSRYPDPLAEAELTDFLQRRGPIRSAAIRALARMGTARSVDALLALDTTASRRAVARIRSRAAGSSGALSLAHSLEGALSPSDRTAV